MKHLRVTTLNIWNKFGRWEERLPIIRKGIQILEPDLLGLQEVLRFVPNESVAKLTPSNDQATELAEAFRYDVAYAPAHDYLNGLAMGNALLSKYPILEERTFRLPGSESGESRALLYALIDSPCGRLPVFVTHLNWKFHHGSVRVRQIAFIAERIAELSPAQAELLPPIFMGDFNAEPDSDEIRFLRGLHTIDGKSVHFTDVWHYAPTSGPGYTFDRTRNAFAASAREPPRRIDYIFVRGPDEQRRGEPMSAALSFVDPEHTESGLTWASDHFGVVADIAF